MVRSARARLRTMNPLGAILRDGASPLLRMRFAATILFQRLSISAFSTLSILSGVTGPTTCRRWCLPADHEGFGHAVDAPFDRGAAVAVDADDAERIAVAAEEAPGVIGRVLVIDADDLQPLSLASAVSSGASSWHGTHQDAQTLTTLTLPLKSAGSSPGTGAPLWTRPSSGGSAVCGAGRPIRADGIFEGSPPSSRTRNSAASATKPISGSATSQAGGVAIVRCGGPAHQMSAALRPERRTTPVASSSRRRSFWRR